MIDLTKLSTKEVYQLYMQSGFELLKRTWHYYILIIILVSVFGYLINKYLVK